MSGMLSNTLLILIVSTAGLVLIGATIAAIRITRFVRRERRNEDAVKARWMAEAREIKKESGATPE